MHMHCLFNALSFLVPEARIDLGKNEIDKEVVEKVSCSGHRMVFRLVKIFVPGFNLTFSKFIFQLLSSIIFHISFE